MKLVYLFLLALSAMANGNDSASEVFFKCSHNLIEALEDEAGNYMAAVYETQVSGTSTKMEAAHVQYDLCKKIIDTVRPHKTKDKKMRALRVFYKENFAHYAKLELDKMISFYSKIADATQADIERASKPDGQALDYSKSFFPSAAEQEKAHREVALKLITLKETIENQLDLTLAISIRTKLEERNREFYESFEDDPIDDMIGRMPVYTLPPIAPVFALPSMIAVYEFIISGSNL